MHQTRLHSRDLPAGRQGEITLTFVVVSLILMVIGSGLGFGVNKSQDVRTQAAGAICGKSCTSYNDCGTDSFSKTLTTCDPKLHKCTAVRDPKNPPCIATAGNTLQECNQHCDNAEQCNATDTATGISLTCDIRSHTCQQKYVNDARQCPGYLSPTPKRTTTGGTSGGTTGGSPAPTGICPADGRFSSRGFSCGFGFNVCVDPVISDITLTPLTGTGAPVVISTLGAAFTDSKTGWTSPVGYRMWRRSAAQQNDDNLIVEWDPGKSYGVAGVNKGALHIRVLSGDTGNQQSTVENIVNFYWNNIPAWMREGRAANIKFDYYVTYGTASNKQQANYSQTQNSNACPGGTQVTPSSSVSSPTPTRSTVTPSATRTPSPSRTPTPFVTEPGKKACNSPCNTNDECGYSLGGVQLVCRAPAGSSIKKCLRPDSDSPQCYSPTATPTQIPTATTVPSRTPTPTKVITPTVVPCQTTIDFMIDASHTTQEKLQPYQQAITNAVRSYGADPTHKNDRITFYTSYFAKTVRNHSGGPFTASNFNFPIQFNLHWTNLKDALESINGNTIFISDGLPSIVNYGGGEKGLCVYSNGDYMKNRNSNHKAEGCYPVESQEDGFRHGLDTCARECSNSYDQAYSDSLVTRNKNNTYGIFVNSGAYANRSFVEAISKEVIDVSEVTEKIGEIFDKACNRSSSQSGTSVPHTLMSSYTVRNQSTTKTIESVTVKACNAQGGNCQEFVNQVSVLPGSTTRFAQAIASDISPENRAVLTCDVQYTDGTSLPCPQKSTNDDGLQFDLSVADDEITGDTLTFLQAADLNQDGTVNGADYARYAVCFVQQANNPTEGAPCDILADGLVNAQDTAILVERFGQSTQ